MALPMWRYDGPVLVVATPADLDRAQAAFRREHVVGLDTETRPTFKKGQSFLPSLVQVATADMVYLFQLRRLDCSAVLREMLESPFLAKAGIGLDHDFVKLKQVIPFAPQNVVDLAKIASRHGIAQPGIRTLVALFFRLRMPKGQQTSNWARHELSPNQIAYAASDAWFCRELFLKFHQLGLQ